MTLFLRGFAAALLLTAASAHAQLNIEIIGVGANQIPIAVAPFQGESGLPTSLSSVVEQDLARSGHFKTLYVPPQNPGLSDTASVDLAAWKSREANAIAVGGVYPGANGRQEARVKLYDVPRGESLGGITVPFAPNQTREAGHRIADFIYEKITGDKGVFSTRIAYVLKTGTTFQLQIAEWDGANPQSALTSKEPIISPAWSPDGTQVAYVSFENKRPHVFVHTLTTGQRRAVATFPGSNSAPGWAPSGNQLAVALSKEGGTQLYLINADGSGVRRLASSRAVDTEPFFSPDGQFIYFTSDRGGGPQIYRMPASGGSVERVTFAGTYNASPRISPDGKQLAMITRNNGRFQIAVQELASGQVTTLTDGSNDESPTFAPNGKTILYASEAGGRGVLASTASNGRFQQRLPHASGGDVREPAWGPYR